MADGLNYNAGGGIGNGMAQVLGTKTIDTAAQIAYQDGNLKLQEIQDLKKERDLVLKGTNVKLDGIVEDINGELNRDKSNLQAAAREILKKEGLNEGSYSKIQSLKDQLTTKIGYSQAQKKAVAAVKRKLLNQNADKYYDREATMDNLAEFASLSITERREFEKDLLVRKNEEYNPFLIPSRTFSRDISNNEKGKAYFGELLSMDPEMNKWYMDGVEQGHWNDPATAWTFWQRENDLHYADRQPRSPSTKYNKYMDPSDVTVAEDQIRQSGNYMFGTESKTSGVVVQMYPQTKAESFPATTNYIVAGKDGVQSGVLNEVSPIEYVEIDDRIYMYAFKQQKMLVPPSDAKLDLLEEKNGYMVPREKLREAYSTEKNVPQYYYIDVTETAENERLKRPNLFGLFEREIALKNQAALTPEQAAQALIDELEMEENGDSSGVGTDGDSLPSEFVFDEDE